MNHICFGGLSGADHCWNRSDRRRTGNGQRELGRFHEIMSRLLFWELSHIIQKPMLYYVLHDLGVETIPIPRTQIERTPISRTQTITANVNAAEYETIDITVLRRGVIGVNKIGYVPA